MNGPERLIVGDGDFSYSVSQLGDLPQQSIITSCIETQEVLFKKYTGAYNNVELINQSKSEF